MSSGDYRVADISLADFGRKEIKIAEVSIVYCLFFRSSKTHTFFLPIPTTAGISVLSWFVR